MSALELAAVSVPYVHVASTTIDVTAAARDPTRDTHVSTLDHSLFPGCGIEEGRGECGHISSRVCAFGFAFHGATLRQDNLKSDDKQNVVRGLCIRQLQGTVPVACRVV